MLADLPSLLDTEIVEDELGWLECPVSVVVRDPDSCLAESDNVRSFVAGQVGNKARVLVDLPPLSGSEVVDRERDGTKSAVSLVQGGVNSSTATTEDVNLPVTRQISNEAGVLVDAPAAGAVAEVFDNALYRRESSVSVVAAEEDGIFAESYDVLTAVSCGVAKEAKVAIEAPTSSGVAEVLDGDGCGIEFRIAVVPGDKDSAIPKSDNVAPPDVSDVSEIADVLVDAPTPSTVGEIFEDEFDGTGKGVVTVVGGD